MKINRFNTLIISSSFLGIVVFLVSCTEPAPNKHSEWGGRTTASIAQLLDDFHQAAASAEFENYFNFYDDAAIFTGTDATERWDKKQFMDYARPHFDRGRAWNFKALDRHIYFSPDSTVVWFDELLNTQMKICRGSGVLINRDGQWKITQYILTATIPNALMDSVVKLKAPAEDALINDYEMD